MFCFSCWNICHGASRWGFWPEARPSVAGLTQITRAAISIYMSLSLAACLHYYTSAIEQPLIDCKRRRKSHLNLHLEFYFAHQGACYCRAVVWQLMHHWATLFSSFCFAFSVENPPYKSTTVQTLLLWPHLYFSGRPLYLPHPLLHSLDLYLTWWFTDAFKGFGALQMPD